ncbi:MMPL family transporter [Hamadaea tsunoensis]|uniref:MMPL family transporter n=1 Tax=Hamadaea tsunoensis TaxID=53368 RepID=UPI0009FD219B|nr:efflux RND transporter permease subunit [Hamadaea tsunoensis]
MPPSPVRRHRWPVIVVWTLLTLAGGVLGGGVYSQAQTVHQLAGSAESMRAGQRLQELIPEGPTVFAVVRGIQVYDPAIVQTVSDVAADLRQWPAVKEVGDPYTGAANSGIGDDNASILVRVELRTGSSDADVAAVAAELHKIKATNVLVGGQPLAEKAFTDQAVADAALGEGIALVALAILLIALLRWGAVVPLAAAAAAVTTTLLVLTGLARVTAVSDFTVNIVTLLGLGLAVDYALVLLWRYREELSLGRDRVEALATAVRTAGRAVLISGGIVAAAMAGLATFSQPLLAAMALGGLVVVVVSTAVALTLSPALIAVLGRRITPKAPAVTGGVLGRLTGVAQRNAGTVALAAVAGLLLLAAPFASVALGNSDVRALPASAESRQAYEAYFRLFQREHPDPVTVVLDGDAAGERMRDYLDHLNRLPGVAQLQLRFGTPAGATVVDLRPATAEGATALVRTVRGVPAPHPALVGGPAAELVDYQDSVRERLPYAFLILLAAAGALLFALTRSVVIPVKAVLLNLLTLAASLGVLAAVFGGRLDLTTPVLLFVFIFGLSTDYEVFLLARITEEHRAGAATTEAVRRGVARIGPVVTWAATGLIVVFLGFVAGRLVSVREIGVGMAVAIFLDVTVVRGLLLPASMELLGRWNWWPGGRPGRPAGRVPRPSPAGDGSASIDVTKITEP